MSAVFVSSRVLVCCVCVCSLPCCVFAQSSRAELFLMVLQVNCWSGVCCWRSVSRGVFSACVDDVCGLFVCVCIHVVRACVPVHYC